MGVFHFICGDRLFKVVAVKIETDIVAVVFDGRNADKSVQFKLDLVPDDVTLKRVFSGLCREMGRMKLGDEKMEEMRDKLGLDYKEIGKVYVHLASMYEVISEVDPKF